MLRRMKQAALVLAGYRPAEVRFDEEDRRIAKEIARVWAVTFAGGYPELEGTYPDMIDDATDMVFLALKDNATWRRQGDARKQRESLERQMEIPF